MRQGQTPPIGIYKFVRDGTKIAYDDPENQHIDIAIQHRLGEKRMKGPDTIVLVDDAGYIRVDTPNDFVVDDQSSTCVLRSSDFRGERDRTVELIAQITGKNVSKF